MLAALFSWAGLLKAATWAGQKILGFLNAKVEADARVQIATAEAGASIAGSLAPVVANADSLNAQRSPTNPLMWYAYIILGLVTFHLSQVILDSCPWHIWFGPNWLPMWKWHVVGSWEVAKLPGVFDTTEHAIITSLFVGATAAVSVIAAIRGVFRK